ncbi:hypothetical protein ACQRZG_14590 [Acetobacter pasteurianus]
MCIARLRSKIRQNRAEKRPFQRLFIQKTASSFSERERVTVEYAENIQKVVKLETKGSKKEYFLYIDKSLFYLTKEPKRRLNRDTNGGEAIKEQKGG